MQQDLGTVKIRLEVLTPVDDLNYTASYIDINITLASALYQNDYYEAAITPGEQFGLFTTTETNITENSTFSAYYSLYVENFSTTNYYANYSTYKHVLVSRDSSNRAYPLKANTKITMLDMATNKYYYYVVTSTDENANKYVYNLSNFLAMGSQTEYYDESSATSLYYNQTQDLIYENFIFHIDVAEADIQSDVINNTLLMELRDTGNQTLIGVLGIQRDTMLYSIYKNKEATIDVTATVSSNTVYLGKSFNLNVTSDFQQNVINSKTIYDTKYFGQKMGIRISFYDSNGNRLNSDSLLGVSFTLNSKKYYPRFDGTVRINVAEKVSNVLSKIKIDTADNKTIATGSYTIRVDSFGSPDGIYYGLTPSDSVDVPISIINSSYGLKVYSDDKSKVVDKTTGNTLNGNNSMIDNIQYVSGLTNPNIAVSIYRRDYSSIYSQEYTLVDLANYVSGTLTATPREKEYVVSANPAATFTSFFSMKPNLTTGTYKLVFKLYDSNNYIGEAYEYFVIK